MNLDKYLDDLQSVYLFKQFNKNELERLLIKYNLKIKIYRKDSIISSNYDRISSLNIILDGVFTREFSDANNNIITLNRLEKGDSFGGMGLFNKNYIEGCFTLFALSDVTTLEISRDDLLTLCQENRQILINFLETISFKVIELQAKVEILSCNSARERIIYYLRKSYLKCSSTTIVLDKNKKQLSEYLGIQRTSLSRELNRMKEDKILTYNRHSINILDLNTILK